MRSIIVKYGLGLIGPPAFGSECDTEEHNVIFAPFDESET